MARQDVIFLSVLIAAITIVASAEDCQYTISIQTGTRKNSGTDSKIGVLLGDKDVHIQIMDLVSWGGTTPGLDYFENGDLDTFNGTAECVPNPVCFMTLFSDNSGNKPGWYPEYVNVTMSKIGTWSTHQFTVQQWLALSEEPYKIFAKRDDCPSGIQSLESMNP
ncbi:PLAT domain-containing protein 3-like [Raphanus sativus]|uniref:PLAT domain-containing protein 3-like n=1 Tax=Raphanus sativus TaxID=3726 RepID=A0A9W3BZ68_RAPSA|nr:PLAT domain-containing protein 3-like [Raphanus sativus]